MTAYTVNVPDVPNALFKNGNEIVNMAHDNHKAKVATDIA